MALPYRFIDNLEASIKDKKGVLEILALFLHARIAYFQVKLGLELCHFDFQNILQNKQCRKSRY